MSNSMLNRSLSLLLAAGLLVLLTRCGPKEPASGTFGSVYSIFQTANCTQCHAPDGGSAKAEDLVTLDLTTQTTAFSTLTTSKVTSTTLSPTCGSVSLVVAGDSERSYLPNTIFVDQSTVAFTNLTGCEPYPASVHTNWPFSAAQKQSIIDWITNGALNN